MRRFLVLLVAALPAFALAGVIAVSLYIETAGTSSTQSVIGVSGELVATEISVSGTASVALATTAGQGSSISGAKTIRSAGLVTNTARILHTNVFLYNDTVTLTATSNAAYAETIKVLLILK